MLESYFIYFFICICLLLGAFADKQTKHISGWLSIIICSIILGYRYDVGIDHLTYLDYYNKFLYLGAKIGTSREYGYDLLNYICARIGCSPGVFFSLTVFIQFTLIYYSFRSKTNFLVLIYFFYMTTGQLFGSLNIIRQAMAFSIFLYIIKYIESRKLVKYLVGVLIAFSFHSSSLILIPIYWLPPVWRLTLDKIGAKGHVILYLGITLSSTFMSSSRISTSVSSEISGITSSDAKEVWRLPLLSKGETRTKRCTPASDFKYPYALVPSTKITALFSPASSPSK